MGFNSGFKGLKNKIDLNYTEPFSSYRAVNTLCLGYKKPTSQCCTVK